jgi:hypothetical protein
MNSEENADLERYFRQVSLLGLIVEVMLSVDRALHEVQIAEKSSSGEPGGKGSRHRFVVGNGLPTTSLGAFLASVRAFEPLPPGAENIVSSCMMAAFEDKLAFGWFSRHPLVFQDVLDLCNHNQASLCTAEFISLSAYAFRLKNSAGVQGKRRYSDHLYDDILRSLGELPLTPRVERPIVRDGMSERDMVHSEILGMEDWVKPVDVQLLSSIEDIWPVRCTSCGKRERSMFPIVAFAIKMERRPDRFRSVEPAKKMIVRLLRDWLISVYSLGFLGIDAVLSWKALCYTKRGHLIAHDVSHFTMWNDKSRAIIMMAGLSTCALCRHNMVLYTQYFFGLITVKQFNRDRIPFVRTYWGNVVIDNYQKRWYPWLRKM